MDLRLFGTLSPNADFSLFHCFAFSSQLQQFKSTPKCHSKESRLKSFICLDEFFLPFLFFSCSKFNTHSPSWFCLSIFRWAITGSSLQYTLCLETLVSSGLGPGERHQQSEPQGRCVWLIRPAGNVTVGLLALVSQPMRRNQNDNLLASLLQKVDNTN